MIKIQGIERVNLTQRIDEVRQRISAIENRFQIGGDFQTTLENAIARQAAPPVQATQKVAATQKMPGTSQPVNAAQIENSAKVAEAIKSAEKNSATEKVSTAEKNSIAENTEQKNSTVTAGQYFNGAKKYLAGEEALPMQNHVADVSPQLSETIDEEIFESDEDISSADLVEDTEGGTTEEMLLSAAVRHGVDPKLVQAIAIAESNMNQDEISEVGAIGVMQLMPETAASLGVNPYDEQENIEGGAMYLKQMLDKFGDVPQAVAAYNAGPGAVQKYGGVPPYAETQNYVGRVMDMYVG